jgi:adenosylcobalamin-dependent ribonucleoside-diphosphate reductase
MQYTRQFNGEPITWEERTAEIKQGDTSVFRQENVRVPSTWSQLATNIAASKYFYGQLGTSERETGVDQLVARVADTIANWGLEDGYFYDKQDFRADLTWLLLHQYCAFNSPVWFNVGLYQKYGVTGDPCNWYWDKKTNRIKQAQNPFEYPQCSACFLQDVEDNMESIMDLARSDAMLFKFGSGTGTNLSPLRASCEGISGGGHSSGPLSFMRIYDQVAEVVSSCGKTRRAALLHCLDIDHPDIDKFINCKSEEEAHARMLIDRGVTPERAAKSVMYQNMNISIQISDEFMQAVEADEDWVTKWVTDGRDGPIFKARDLWKKIAESTWLCGDPGVQFSDTINNYNTIPHVGRIVTSNPCGEFLAPKGGAACNLASINLLKFLRDGKFDYETFQKVVRILIIAQDILVDRASYPLKDIAKNAHRCRQLGLGYTNLGALIMSMGLAYDSDEARSLCSNISAVLTARAYLTSAELAEELGEFEEYNNNMVEMHGVLELHADATGQLSDLAQQLWNDVLERPIFRNSQVTLAMPAGTVSFLMDCDTTGIEPELALVKTKTLVGGGTLKLVNKSVEAGLRALGISDPFIPSLFNYLTKHETLIGSDLTEGELKVFATSLGDNQIPWEAHLKMMAASQPYLSGGISKCVTGDTRITTTTGLQRIDSFYSNETPDTFSPLDISVSTATGLINTDSFYYGGLQTVRTITTRSGHKITGTLNHPLLTQDGWKTINKLTTEDYVAIQYGQNLWSTSIPTFETYMPILVYGNQKTVTIPHELTKELAMFLGAYTADGNITRCNWSIIITKKEMGVLKKLQSCILSCFGISAGIYKPKNRCPYLRFSSKSAVEFLDYLGVHTGSVNKTIPECIFQAPKGLVIAFLSGLFLDSCVATPYWKICSASNKLLDELQIILTNLGIIHGRMSKYNYEYERYYDEVYACGEAAKKLLQLVPMLEKHKKLRAKQFNATSRSNTANIIPLDAKKLYATLPNNIKQKYHDMQYNQHFTVDKARQLMEDGVELPSYIKWAIDNDFIFSPVSQVSKSTKELVYDISVPNKHNFIGNGIVNHNTINMPANSTVEDIQDAYMLGWKLGLKSVAIYRDNSKGSQPLNIKHTAPEAISVRKRLPDTRESITHKFTIDGHKGYFTVGLYPNGQPGELFISVAKEGSTLGGIFDCFGLATSIGLQYGVPLSEFIDKFTHVRFEPMGFTKNPDIKIAKSIIDYIFRWLAIKFQNGALPHDANEPTIGTPVAPSGTLDAPICGECGALTTRVGACFLCYGCGTSGGCS